MLKQNMHNTYRKLDVAERLAEKVLEAAVLAASGGGQGGELPLPVAAHYLRAIADWLISCLLSKQPQKTTAKQASKPQAKHWPAAGTLQPRHPREEPRCWGLLAYVLEAAAPLLHGGASTSAGLAAAAAAACDAAAAGGAEADGAALAAALQGVLGVLGQRYQLSYRPALEQQATLLASALRVLLAGGGSGDCGDGGCGDGGGGGGSPWAGLASAQLEGFRAAAQSHPNPRKVSGWHKEVRNVVGAGRVP
jgi:hypothetical protein